MFVHSLRNIEVPKIAFPFEIFCQVLLWFLKVQTFTAPVPPYMCTVFREEGGKKRKK